jgi:hypothetical protein
VEDLSMKVGLLMEAAESQQALAAAALERLREHAAAIDGIVREEIRSTLIEELAALEEDSRRAAQSLRALKQAASARLAAWSVGLTALSASIPFGAAWWLLPSRHSRRAEYQHRSAHSARWKGRVATLRSRAKVVRARRPRRAALRRSLGLPGGQGLLSRFGQ